MAEDVDKINSDFYNHSGDSFNSIPFETVLPELFLKYGVGGQLLEIGSGPGALAVWLRDLQYQVTCLEPAKKSAERAIKQGLDVHTLTIQQFETDLQYDCIVAISSLIHVPKEELPLQIKKIAHLLKPRGIFFVSFIEGEDEGFEDPTKLGKLRYFAKWSESDLERLLSPYFDLLESHRIHNKKMNQSFLLRVYILKN
ncbi:MAG: class I SAM-dependent methyltransferase [Chlamydiales bacterium]|nr:class I SAM-dependent methyltransferase [Chlamydiales bacterium]